ncbi:transposase, partial [mine drainage metagenome]
MGAVHVIATLDRVKARPLFEVPLNQYREVAKDGQLQPVHGYATKWHGYGRDWRVLVTYRKGTAEEQREGWEATKKRVLTKVAEWKPGRSQKSVMRRLVQLVPRPFHGVFEYGVEKELMARKDGVMVPRFRPYCRVPTEVEERLRASLGEDGPSSRTWRRRRPRTRS